VPLSRESSKDFFFENKKQKTFTSLDTPVQTGKQKKQKFFASFFQKRSPCLTAGLPALQPQGSADKPGSISATAHGKLSLLSQEVVGEKMYFEL